MENNSTIPQPITDNNQQLATQPPQPSQPTQPLQPTQPTQPTQPSQPMQTVQPQSTPTQFTPTPDLTQEQIAQGYHIIDKNVFTWVFAFLLGNFGVDRFVRGQVGIGICKLLFNWLTLGIWALVDWIIAMVKAYGSAYSNTDKFTFDNTGKYTR